MTLRQLVDDFTGSVVGAATRAPDEYPAWSSLTYENHMEDIRELWAKLQPRLKDENIKTLIQSRLDSMFSAFESGDKETGRAAAWDIYNIGDNNIR